MGNESYVVVTQILVFSVILYQLSILSFDGPFVKSSINNTHSYIYSNALNYVTYSSIFIFILIGTLFPNIYLSKLWGGSIEPFFVYFFVIYSVIYTLSCRNLIYFQSKNKLTHYSVYQLLQYIGQLLSVVIGFYFNSVIMVLSVMITFEFSLLIFGARFSKQFFWVYFEMQSYYWLRSNTYMALALVFSVLSIWAINNIGRLIIPNMGDLNQLAMYGVSMSIALLGGIFINPFCSLLFPVLAKKESFEQNKNNTFIGLLLVTITTYCCSYFILLFSPELQSLIAKPELYPSFFFYSLSALSLVLLGSSRIYSLYFIVNDRLSNATRIFIVNAVVTLFLSVCLFRPWGIIAIPFSMLMGIFISQLFFYKEINELICINKYVKQKMATFFVLMFFLITIGFPVYADAISFGSRVMIYFSTLIIFYFMFKKLFFLDKLVCDFKVLFLRSEN